MTDTLSVRLSTETKRRLDALARRSRRSRSLLAAEAISRYVETEEWQIAETEAGIDDLEQGRTVSHDEVSSWLKTWGSGSERKAPK